MPAPNGWSDASFLDEVPTRFGRGRWVLDGIDLVPEPGSVEIVGGNGSGTSTLLRILAGIARPHAPPTRRIPDVFDRADVGGLGLVVVGTSVLVATLISVSLVVGRRRT